MFCRSKQGGDSRDGPWLIMLIPYFGRWPEWINLFVESCKWNPSVRWKIYTDCGEPENKADNVDYTHLSFDDYKALVRQRLGVVFHPTDAYKLCDVSVVHLDWRRAAVEGFCISPDGFT